MPNLEMKTSNRLATAIVSWYRSSKRDLPWRRKPFCDDPYCVYVSEIMLQQTQVKTVIPYWERWMRELPTIQSLAEARPERVLKLWEGLGYYSRARNLQKAAQEIVARHGGVFPTKLEDILELPGIGRYTAGAIASIAFGLPAPIVDGNVARVLTRLLGLRGDPKSKATSAALWENAARLVKAASSFGDLNQGLMELGATVCLPRQPRCDSCPIQPHCYAWKNGKTADLPEIAPRAAAQARRFRAALMIKGNKIFLRQREAGMINGGFWELPNIEANGETPAETFQQLFEAAPEKISALCEIKHTITRYRMTLELFRVSKTPLQMGKWLNVNQLGLLPVVNSHRKALQKAGVI